VLQMPQRAWLVQQRSLWRLVDCMYCACLPATHCHSSAVNWKHFCLHSSYPLVVTCAFYARKQTCTAVARLSHRNSVCPSVGPAVRPSHGWISQKRCKLGSSNLHRWLPGRLLFQNPQSFSINSKGVTLSENAKWRGRKNSWFLTNKLP